jgi:uncharacterized protein YydD (DUF2326 family)
MKIIKLYSDLKGFNTVKFNEKGISLIRGVEKSDKNKDTYNGVGKTLLFYLIDYCFGTKTIAEGLEQLDCNIFVDILINNQILTIERNCKDRSKHKIKNQKNEILLEGTKKIISFLEKEIGVSEYDYSTFRGIIGFFLRYKDSSFLREIAINAKTDEYFNLLNSAYLLNIDTKYLRNKYKYNKDINEVH